MTTEVAMPLAQNLGRTLSLTSSAVQVRRLVFVEQRVDGPMGHESFNELIFRFDGGYRETRELVQREEPLNGSHWLDVVVAAVVAVVVVVVFVILVVIF